MKDINTNSFYRDKVNKKVTGVCAGLASVFKLDAWVVRVLAIVCLIAMPTVTAIAYLLASVLLPAKYSIY